MTNPTVKELIEKLQQFDPNSIVCIFSPHQPDAEKYATVENTHEKEANYINDDGDLVYGKIVIIG